MEIINQVRNTLKEYQMLKKGDRVLLCVSGGPDSVFLLKAFLYLKDEFGVRLFIANIDHGIRGRESRDDSLFVKNLSKENNTPLYFKKLKFRKERRLSVEETARKERYDFFSDAAIRGGINKIATAHTLDDLAETVLMRIIKGTSLKGIIGIPPKRQSKNATYIRPLIALEKKDIIGFLKKNRIAYKIDSSNLENIYFRNITRNKILPYLSRYNPRIKRALANLAETLREDKEFIDSQKKMHNLIFHKDAKVFLRLKDILIQPAALQKEITRDALIKAGSNIKKLNFRHWKEIHQLMNLKPSGKSLDLPGGIRLRKEKEILLFDKS